MSYAPQLSENAPHILHPLACLLALYEARVETGVIVPKSGFRQVNCGARPGARRDLPSNDGRLPTWKEWIESKGIGKDTAIRHFRGCSASGALAFGPCG